MNLILKVGLVVVLYSSANAFAGYARVVKVKGDVTKLLPGALTASKVLLNDGLPEDTSLLTNRKSFVRIEFSDGSVVTLGPNSKIVVSKLSEHNGKIIGLLKGKLRATIKESANKNPHFYVRTKTAAMAVRGTDFSAIYGPEVQNTALVTYKGSVAMAKMDGESKEVRKVQKIDRDSSGKVRVSEKVEEASIPTAEELEKTFNKKTVALVKAGQFSGAYSDVKAVTRPVKINPVQFSVLYTNQEMMDEPVAREKAADPSQLALGSLYQADQEVPPEGMMDEKKEIFAPKAGGIIDLASGQYIAPDSDQLDEKTGVYRPKEMGTLCPITGAFIPPAGLKFDPTKGFVAMADSKEVQEKAKAMNQTVASNMMKPKEEIVEEPANRFSKEELYKKNLFAMTFRSFESDLSLEKNSFEGSRDFKDSDHKGFALTWYQSGVGQWRTFVGVQYDSTKYRGSEFTQSSGSLFGFNIGVSRYLSERWDAYFKMVTNRELFADYSTANAVTTKSFFKAAITRFLVGAKGDLIRSGPFGMSVFFEIGPSLSKKTLETRTRSGLARNFGLGMSYALTPKNLIEIEIFNEYLNADVENGSFSNEQTIERDGVRLNYTFAFDS